jgi:hypothetical protein
MLRNPQSAILRPPRSKLCASPFRLSAFSFQLWIRELNNDSAAQANLPFNFHRNRAWSAGAALSLGYY